LQLLWRWKNAKNREYKQWAEERGAKFFPFVVESHGAFGNQTVEVFRSLAKAAATTILPMPPRQYMHQFKSALSVALQRGNGLVAKMGAVQTRAANAAAQRAAMAR